MWLFHNNRIWDGSFYFLQLRQLYKANPACTDHYDNKKKSYFPTLFFHMVSKSETTQNYSIFSNYPIIETIDRQRFKTHPVCFTSIRKLSKVKGQSFKREELYKTEDKRKRLSCLLVQKLRMMKNHLQWCTQHEAAFKSIYP